MISDDRAREILDVILKTNECLERIKEVVTIRNGRVYSGISEYVLHLEDSVAQHYVLGAFLGCVVLSRTVVERALLEELSRKGYSNTRLKNLELEGIIKSAEDEGILSKDNAEKADEIRIRGNNYVHAILKGRSISSIARSQTRIEDWISTNKFIENQKLDAKKSFEDVADILYELYSEKRHPT
jgi:hypothetical protein